MALPLLLGIGRLAAGLGRIASRSLGSVRVTTRDSSASKRLEALGKELETIPPKAYNYFKQKTPVDSGNARRKTSLQGNTINADYDYATRLDQGYSKKARQGMSKPTIEYVKRLIKQSAR